MKNVFGIALLLIFVSCAYIPTVDYSYPHIGSSNNASIVVKDYETLGIIFVKSSEMIDGNGNHTGSRITYEMIMLEAQKLSADDVINIKIDVNQIVDFSITGEPIKTTFNYTATALAIKYTSALSVGDNRGNNSQNIGNEYIILDKMERSSIKASEKNWVSVGATTAGAGLKYERIFNNYWSLTADVYYQNFGIFTYHEFGIGATARLYPFGNIFYIGTGLGIHGYEYGYYTGNIILENYTREGYIVGFAITPEIGMKIDVGKPGGFFMDIGTKVPQIFGGEMGYWFSIVPYVGFGGAF